MSGFKLLAIRTPDKCEVDGKDLLKVLSPSTIYPFYSSYSFPNNNFEQIMYHENRDVDIYSSETGPNISISAIVGTNGSGKSTLTELFLMANYNLGASFKILKECICEKEEEEKGDCNCNESSNQTALEPKKEFALEILFCTKKNELISLNFKDGKIKKNIFSTRDENEYKIVKSEDLNKKDLQEICYSIVVNYSHYALNSEEIGDWINPLFHKNDGYQTPIVINPMRTDGNIDINIENELLRDRLMSNLLEPINSEMEEINSLRNIAGGKIAKKLKITINKEKIARHFFVTDPDLLKKEQMKDAVDNGPHKAKEYVLSKNSDEIIKAIDEIFHFNFKELDIDDPYVTWGVNYFFRKITSLKAEYNPIRNFSFYKGVENWERSYVLFIDQDKSHIAFKLKRVIYFLKYYEKFWKSILNQKTSINIEDVSKTIIEIKKIEHVHNSNDLSTIELMLPSYLNIGIILNDDSLFNDLSSGEKHKIFSISSIIYHLINLNSVKSKSYENGDVYLKYTNANIILDEIELYYHPEWQRKFINDLIGFISKINPLHIQDIKGINFIFITHSPFILSDIPHTNVLFLERKDENNPSCRSLPIIFEKTKLTLGANIHDLLIDTFFMTSTIGEFSRDKINEFAKHLNNTIKYRNEEKTKLLKKSRLELELLGGEKFIQLIGDTLIRDKLFQLYFLAIEQNDTLGLRKYYERKLNDLNN